MSILAGLIAAACTTSPCVTDPTPTTPTGTVSTASAGGSLDSVSYGEQAVGPLKHSGRLQALGDDLLGESINGYTGGLSFSQTDLAVPGNNGLTVSAARRFLIDGNKSPATPAEENLWRGYSFGEWDFDLPYLSATHAEAQGWTVGTASPNARCSSPTSNAQFRPNDVTVDGVHFSSYQFWNGASLYVPGQGEQKLLTRDAVTPLPMPTGAWTALTTASQWHFSCLTTLKSGQAGEGFMGLAPDGTKYYFDWMVAYPERSLHGREQIVLLNGPDMWATADLPRKAYRVYPTRIEDRVGNWVTYSWSGGNLMSVASSDGRSLTYTYTSGVVSSVSDGVRTVNYAYTDGLLTSVTLPDTSKWTYASAAVIGLPRFVPLTDPDPWDFPMSCQRMRRLDGAEADLQVTHPSGAVGTFRMLFKRHFRTNLAGSTAECATSYRDDAPAQPKDDYPYIPTRFDTLAVKRKTLSGPGLSALAWEFAHQDTWTMADYPVQGTRTVTTTEPDGTVGIAVYGTDALNNESQLLSSEVREAGATLSHTANTYVQTSEISGMPFPDWMGEPLEYETIRGRGDYNRPLKAAVVSQQGAAFFRTVDSFDPQARPVSVTKRSELVTPGVTSHTKTEATTYSDHLGKWVLGQVQQVTVNGILADETTFDPTTAFPTVTKQFGRTLRSMTYNADGTLATVKDGRNNTTTLSDWYRGIPRLIQYPGASTSATVNPQGWVTAVNDELGNTTCYGYDAMGRLASVTHPSESAAGVCDTSTWAATTLLFEPVAVSEYGLPAGHWRQTVSTGNARKVSYFDALWRPVLTREYDTANVAGTSRFTALGYDHDGRTTFTAYPVATATTVAGITQGVRTDYDGLGRVIRVDQDSELGVLGTTTQYLAGFQTRVTNPRGFATTTTAYQAFDQPAMEAPLAITHPEGAYTDIARDVFGKPTSLTRSGGTPSVQSTRSYVYDGYQQLCKTIEPETGATVMDYDLAGNLAWSAAGLILPNASCDTTTAYNSGRRVDRTYDARNRLATLRFPDGNGNQDWSYYATGRPQQVVTQNGGVPVTNSYVFKRRGLLASETQVHDINTWTLTYGYNPNGHQTSLAYPAGLTVNHTVNALGQVTGVTGTTTLGTTTYASSASYFPNGALKQFTYGNGIVHTLDQNARGLPDRSKDAYLTSVIALDDSYDYDGNGNVVAISDGRAGARGNRTMTYDDLDRLETTASPMFGGTVATYAYDVLDNLTRVVAPGRDHWYCYDTKWQLTNVKTGDCSTGASVIGLGYDSQGNLNNKNGQLYSFDYGNRLRSATNLETYRYDAHGRRVLADKPGSGAGFGKIFSLYANDGTLLWTRDERASKRIQHVYLAGSLIAQRSRPTGTDVETLTYQHTDALGSPVAVTNTTKGIVETSEFEPYGKLLNRALTDGPGYTGHVSDAATGHSYMQQRYYDPGIGRFLSVDPVTADGNSGGNFNRYWYANNNPYKFTDPDGRLPLPVWGAIGGAVIEGVRSYREGNSAGEVLRDAGIGAAVGAVSTLPGGRVLAASVRSGLASGAGDAVKQMAETGSVDGKQTLKAALTGVAVGGVAKGAANRLVPNRNIPGVSQSSPLVRQGRALPQAGSEASAAPVRGAVENAISTGHGAGTAAAATPPSAPPKDDRSRS